LVPDPVGSHGNYLAAGFCWRMWMDAGNPDKVLTEAAKAEAPGGSTAA
jgi:hypothetical protein